MIIAQPLVSLVTFLVAVNSMAFMEQPIIQQPSPPDYSVPAHWLALPDIRMDVDVFYLYPTAWKKLDAREASICAIDNPVMLKYAPLAYARQATAFDTVGAIFAPYYRQLDVASRAGMSAGEQERIVAGIPTSDATAAFDWYITHFNEGRPFILAAHSLGSNVLANLLSDYMRHHPEVYERMIAAYVIGYSITTEYLAQNPHLKFAESANDTGVIVSYNTESPDVLKGTNPVTLPGGIAINPVSWTRGETRASAGENLGSIVLNNKGTVAAGIPVPVMNYADARVDTDKGVVICSSVDVDAISPGTSSVVRGTFHSYDYPFYYYNLRQNAENRTAQFFKKSRPIPKQPQQERQ